MTFRLKDTTRRADDGSYLEPSAEHIFKDYQFSVDQQIQLPD
jgi:nitronate monooxygenase